jgi:D-sedoheptulose 7-phosphate isomerase
LVDRLSTAKSLVESLDTKTAMRFASEAWGLRTSGGKLFFMGNGASHTIASHAALDYMSQTGIQTVCVSDPAVLTAFSNDFGYENALERFVKIAYKPGDILVCISSSGNSENVVNAAKYVSGASGKLYVFTGFDMDNELNSIASCNRMWVDSDCYNIVESIHNMWLAMICDVLSCWMGSAVGPHGLEI